MTRPVVEVENVSKRFRLYHERTRSLKQALMLRGRSSYSEFWALQDVSFEIPEGSTFGLIGENGSGKSTLLKCIAKIYRPDSGSVRSRGKLAALLELGSGFHPELSGRENVYLNGAILGLSKKQIDSRFEGIVDFAGIEEFIDQPVKNYSSGMYVRLGFSVAINVDPDVLLVDEVLAVGDASFQQKCLEKFAEYREAGRTVVVVSHAMGQLRNLCDRVAWLEHGKLRAVGTSEGVVDDYVDEIHHERDPDGSGSALLDLQHRKSRWGSGEISIDRVEMFGPQGTPTSRLHTGEHARVRLHYSTVTAVERPVFGIAINTVAGAEVTGPNTRDTGDVPERLDGPGYVDFDVPRLALLPGTFDLTAVVYDFTCQHPIDHRNRVLRFDVLPGAPREGNGIVTLNGEWTYSNGDPGVVGSTSTSAQEKA